MDSFKLAPYIIIAIFNVLMLGGLSFRTYRIPRDLFVSLSSFGMLIWWLCEGASFYLAPWIGVGVLITLGWWFVCSMMSPRTDISTNLFVPFGSVLILCAIMQGGVDVVGMRIIMISVLLNCIYALAQNIFKWDMFPKGSHRSYPLGFLGNTNYLGIWLSGCFFLGVWLSVVDSMFWLIANVCILYTIWVTKCRAAFIGTICGVSYFAFTFFGALGFGLYVLCMLLVCWFLLHNWGKQLMYTQTIMERLNFWKIGWEQLKQTPLFGLGFAVVRINVPFIQRALNIKSGGRFLDPKRTQTPWCTRVHQDYLQHAVDNGVLGGLLILGWIMYVIYYAHSVVLSPEAYALVAGLICLSVCGLFFHNFHVRPVNMLFWFFIFGILRADSLTMHIDNTMLLIAGVVSLGIFIYHYPIRELRADMHLANYHRKDGSPGIPYKTMKLKPTMTLARTLAAGASMKAQRPWDSFQHTLVALVHSDGEQKHWELWYNLGIVFMIYKQLDLAEMCFKEALLFWPHYETAKQALTQVQRVKNDKMSGTGISAESVD